MLGWTAISIFTANGYVQAGLFQLPLVRRHQTWLALLAVGFEVSFGYIYQFEGTPPLSFLQQAADAPLWNVIAGALKNKTIRYYDRNYPSVFVRVADARRGEELEYDKVSSYFSTNRCVVLH